MPSRKPALFSSRNALLAGFGGLLVLLVLSGLDAVQVLSEMRKSNEAIRREFLNRAGRLEQIRTAVYLSGTYVRDYLLEPDPGRAEQHRAALNETRRKIEAGLAAYEHSTRGEDRDAVEALKKELGEYWRSLNPIFGWDARERREQANQFFRDQVFPRRMEMLTVADRIAAINAQELTAGDRRLSQMFENLRDRLLIVFAVTLLLGVMQAAVSIRQTLRLERAAAQHLEDVTRARTELKELSARLVEAQESERKAISRELHDAVGQSLSAVLFELRNLSAALPVDLSLRAHVETTRRLVETSVGMVRNMALLLRPSMLDDLGLVPALEWQARDVSKRTGILVNVAADELPEDLPDGHKTCIFRVVQEALNNIAKHAEAQTVRISLRKQAGELLLAVQDDGRGFRAGEQKGLGLIGINERVENLRGSVRLESEPGRGALLEIRLPLAGTAAPLAV
jgi:signal transduction histidine kinase